MTTLIAAVAGCSETGRSRKENQDNFLVSDLAGPDGGLLLRPRSGSDVATLAETMSLAEHGAVLIVADGVGGAAAGRLASGLACTFILAELQESWCSDAERTAQQFPARLREAVQGANRRVHEHALRNAQYSGMGTTATVAGLLDDQLCVAQVGDSRAYLVRDSLVTQLTRDQSLLQHMVDTGTMTAEEAEHSSRGNVILQALGAEAEVEVALSAQQLLPGDYLILCSDGLHRMVRTGEIAACIARLIDPELVCEELVTLANSRGGPDNITVVVARIDGLGLHRMRSAAGPQDAAAVQHEGD